VEQPEIRAVILDLQIDQPHSVAGAARRRGDELSPSGSSRKNTLV
jgi:hypothetical protein